MLAVDESFEAFVAARGDALWRSAWLLTGDDGRAEDLIQTALAKAWPHHARVSSGDGSFEAYVRRILVTTYASWWRRRWRGEVPTEHLPDHPDGGHDEAGATRHDVLAALGRLPARQRAVVVLRYYEDHTEADTARLLGCSLGAVKQHHARALRALRGSPLLAPTVHEEELR